MYPEICRIGSVSIFSYGVALVSAFWIVMFLLRRISAKMGFVPEEISSLLFVVFFSGILGGRLLYILLNLPAYIADPLEIIRLQHGGLAWFGGFCGGAAGGIIYARMKKMPVFKLLDLIAPFAALGHAIGRIGCFFNGCCYGKISPYGIYLPVHGEYLIPVQIYSSALLLLIYVLLRLAQERPHKDGNIFLFYLLLYSLKRFFVEFWRGDSDTIVLGLTIFQIFSIIMFVVASAALFIRRRPPEGRSKRISKV